jgi:hypothetical protein
LIYFLFIFDLFSKKIKKRQPSCEDYRFPTNIQQIMITNQSITNNN